MNTQDYIYFTLGHPTAGLRSPEMLNQKLAAKGLGGLAFAVDCPPDGLKSFIPGLRQVQNLRGFLVTMPHKQTIATHLDEVNATAATAGAVNIVRRDASGRLTGGQLDGEGFVAAMKRNGFEPGGKSIYMAGAGGVAAGIATSLAMAGAERVMIANRNAERAGQLATRLSAALPSCRFERIEGEPPDDADAVVNATSVGMNEGDPAPFSLHNIKPGCYVADVVNRPFKTALLRQAEADGYTHQNGQDMVECQLDLMLEFFFKD